VLEIRLLAFDYAVVGRHFTCSALVERRKDTMRWLCLRSMGAQVGRVKGFYIRVKVGAVGIIAIRPLRTFHHHDSTRVDLTWIGHCRPNWRNMSTRLRIARVFGTPKRHSVLIVVTRHSQSHVKLLCNKSLLYQPPSHRASRKVP